MFKETDWISNSSGKFSPLLVEELNKAFRLHKWVPGFLGSYVRTLEHFFGKKSIIIQLAPEHWVTTLNTANLGGSLGCHINHRLEFIDCFSTTVNINTLRNLAAHEAVLKIWYDREVRALLDIATPVVGAPKVWSRGSRGDGVGIAILDTGIFPHPDLVTPHNRIVKFKDFINWRVHPYDDNGHGTHCAGDAAGNGAKSNGKYRGPAPMAKLVGIKVLNRKGSGLMSNILAGIQWCIDHRKKYGIRVLSMSLGGKATTSYKDDPLCRAVEKAWKAGIVVCTAAGNEGPGSGTVGSPGINPDVITVGALDDKGTLTITDDSVASFSSRGPTPDGLTKPDMVAPGVNIISLRAPNSLLDQKNRGSRVGQWYISFSGTSMATPICAGVVAAILEKNPGLTPGRVKSLLMSTCRTINHDPSSQGAGLVDALAAISHI